jgi:uncharacterized 2Fe-2S/4Fe-4S cluster protein (DUF4445 family)
MGKCLNHPEKDTLYVCLKDNVYLCEECLKCREPDVYCKFRPSCPIWFMEQKGLEDQEAEGPSATTHKVTFRNEGVSVDVPEGSTLLDAARAADVYVNASCNGKGSCGKCKLVVLEGSVDAGHTPLLTEEEKAAGYILACQSRVTGDVTVKIPEETIEKKLKVAGMGKAVTDKLKGLVEDITPAQREVMLEMTPPTLDDSISDLDRLKRALKKSGFDLTEMNVSLKVLRELAAQVRAQNWRVTASVITRQCSNEIAAVVPGNHRPAPLGLAVDVGTTSVVVYLVDMTDGAVLAATSGHNRQSSCGDDVINRIICAEKDGVKKLSKLAINTINTLIEEALTAAGVDRSNVTNAAIAGNTVMTHLLLGIEPSHIRREPYIPVVSEFPLLRAFELGLKINATAAVYILPGPAGYVGGDIVSGMLYSGLHREEPLTLFIDVGTNGEIVLGNKDWLLTASCSAGPAFEGGGVRWGMRAEEGAIEQVEINREDFSCSWKTVEDVPPRGICGSGMIDLISEMLLKGVIDQRGKFLLDSSHPRMIDDHGDRAWIVVPAEETGVERDIVFSEADIQTLLLSKGAVYAGFTVLLETAGLDFSAVERFMISGGFGQHLNIDRAVTIGLLPDVARDKFIYLGNSAVAGAYMALLSEKHRKEASKTCRAMTYVDFSSNTKFMDEFTSALFLPHTDMKQFPSVKLPPPLAVR